MSTHNVRRWASSSTRRLELAILGLILLLYAVIASAYAIRTPDWQVPDEPAHYNYIQQIAKTGSLPVIEMGDWNQAYQNMLTRCNFHPVTTGEQSPAAAGPGDRHYLDSCAFDAAALRDLETVEYEDHQPPLYYLVQTPMYAITDGDLTSMRIFSAFIGGGAVICAWAIGRRLFPAQPWLGLTAAALIAFLPQRLSIMAGVSNDSLAELMAGLVLLSVTYYLTWPQQASDQGEASEAGPGAPSRGLQRLTLGMGVLVGLAFLTKSTVYYTAGIAGLAILLRWWREKWPWPLAAQHIALFAVPALLMGAIWWVHGLDIYGGTDFLGLQRHDEVVIGQPRTDDYIETQYGGSYRVYLENLTRTTFQSFWGQFGWMALPMRDGIYRALRLILAFVLAGVMIQFLQGGWWAALRRSQQETLGLFTLAIALVFIQFFLYNMTFVQFQGRYLYPALIPLALLMALGLSGWSGLLARWQPAARWLPVPIAIAMVFFAWYALRDVISVLPEW